MKMWKKIKEKQALKLLLKSKGWIAKCVKCEKWTDKIKRDNNDKMYCEECYKSIE